MSETVMAWHFVGETLRDGRPVPADGVWLEHDGPLVLCVGGLHASLDPWDALQYAPGPILCRVELAGAIVHGNDKLVAERRRIVARRDMTDPLRLFARQCASDVLHLWGAPDVVREYLATGDEMIREAARAASADARAASHAARAASADARAASHAARAASHAAWAAAWSASDARAAARAASDAASDAAWAAASDAQRQRWAGLVAAQFMEQP